MADSDSIAFKQCALCRATKEIREFHRDRTVRDGFCNGCKDCKRSQRSRLMVARGDDIRKKDRDLRRGNPVYIDRAKSARLADVEGARRYQREYGSANREKRAAYRAAHKARHGEKLLIQLREWRRAKRSSDPIYRMCCAARGRIYSFVKARGYVRSKRTAEMIGCEWPVLAAHIEARFTDGMSFENYGAWHVDHVIPLASARSEADLIRLSHYKNLQPLWAADNRRKSASLPSEA